MFLFRFPSPYSQHFHYSYVINAAAVLAHLRPSWANNNNVAWVNTLIRDVNDPNKVKRQERGTFAV